MPKIENIKSFFRFKVRKKKAFKPMGFL